MTSSIDKKKSQYDSDRLISWLRRYCNSDFKIGEMLQNKKIPEDFLYEAGKVGLFGMRIPTEYDGLSMSLLDSMKVIEQLASIDISLATYIVLQHTFSYPILVHANPRFCKYYLPLIATGNIVGSFALSEPGAGSDPRKISTSIEPAGIGRWRINGTKCWITGAASSRMFLVFGRHTNDSYKGISCFAVPGTTAGITIKEPADLLSVTGIGLRSVEFKDVEVSVENLVGEFGRGMVVAESGLLFGRFYTTAMCSGIMKRCSQIMIRYASKRSVGAGSLLESSVTLSKLNWIDSAIIAINTLSKVIAKRYDQGEPIAQDIAIACKVSSSELAWECADKMVQLLGGRGIDDRNFASQILRDTRFFRIGEGPTEPLLIKLGATLSSRKTKLMRFLQDDLKADKALNCLMNAIDEIQELTQDLTDILNKSQVKIFKYYSIGRIGIWSLLEAGLLYQNSVSADYKLLETIEWVKHKFDETLNTIKGDVSILNRNHLVFNRSLEHYEQSIGRFDDTMPVTKENMDIIFKNSVQDNNNVEYDTIRNITVIYLFEQALASHPDKEAVITPTNSLTYRAFAKEVDKLAYILRDDNNIVLGDVIAFCMGKTASFVIGILAALKAGATVLLLNAKEPKERNKLIIEKAEAKMILTEEDLMEFLPATHKKVMAVDSVLATAVDKGTFTSNAIPQSIAYIAFTSGSTGIPKGIRVTHKAICSQLLERQNKVKIDHNARILHTVVPNFDIAIWELFGPFAYGATIALSNDKTFTWDPRSILKLIVQFKATHIQLTPAQLELLLDNIDSQSYSSLKSIICGGEVLKEDIKEKCYQKLPEVDLMHMYGPAEAVIDTTFCRPLIDTNYSSGQIGKPFSNKHVYILDENRQPVATGIPGELYIGGEVLAEGYLGELELTKQSFLSDPFAKVPGAKMYKTGDRVRSLPSGSLEFLGRIDQQIKINGVRIEPGEIENVFKSYPTIEQLKVVAQKSKNTVKLVAYYVSKNKDVKDTRELRDFALLHLPKIMVPSYFVQLDKFPFTSTGKIDLKALMQIDDLDESRKEVADSNPISNAVRNIWESILECKIHEENPDFFEVGGNSLSAIQVLTRIWEIFAVQIDAIEFYEEPTIEGLANKITYKQREKISNEQKISTQREERIPLAGTQKNYWFLYLMNPNSPAYNCPEAMRYKGTLNIKYLEWAINELIKRHEAMRTIFINDEGTPIQVVLNKVDFNLPVVDISKTVKDKKEQVLQELISLEAATPFKLEEKPPFTAKLFKLDDMEYVLLWNFHHIIADGWSSAMVFTNEITELYKARCEERQPVLQEISVQPIDYLYMQKNALSEDKIKKQKAFWKTELEGAPSYVDLSLGRSSLVSKCNNHGHRSYFKVPQDLYDALSKFSLENKVSTYNVLMTTFVSLAHMLSGADDISIGTVIAGRKNTSIKHVMGNFANVVVVRTQLEQEHTFKMLLEQVKNKVLKAMDNSDVPFEELVSTLKPNRDRNKNPLFNIFLSLFNGNGNALELEGSTSQAIQVDPQVARFDFSIAMFEVNQSLEGYVEYKTDLFDETTIVRIIKYYQKMLSTLIHHSKLCIDDVQLVDEEEEKMLCETFNDSYEPFPRDMCLHEMFEEQVKQVPKKTAITFGNISLTYEELNSRANKVAHYLRNHNIETGEFVGICVKSSIEMIVGVLGIVKAGCAYVPLDPNLPRERVKFIVDDIHSKIILTQLDLVEHVADYAETICLDTDWNMLDNEISTNLNIPMKSDNIIYMIFTSGSTGKPKGVRTMHYNVAALLCNTNHMKVSKEDIFLKINNFAFDISTWEIWSPLIYGASMIGIPEKIKLNPQEFADFVYSHNITMAYLPTALFHSISIEVPEAFKGMKLLVVGGEPLDPTRSRDVLKNNPPKEFVNAYGPTEVTCTSAWYNVYELPEEETAVPIGRPISNTQFYVLNAKKKLLPLGVVGELYIGGAGVSNGYHNRPELTRKHFIENNYNHDSKFKRLYRSGDFVRYLPNGNLQFIGRMDHQVKVRGFRIEIGDIENALREHEAVREAIVSVRGNHVDNKQLIAFVSLKKSYKDLNVNVFKDYLKERLPYYMVPSVIMILDSLPHNKNGKIDRIELNKIEITTQGQSDNKVKYPRNAIEVRLKKIWEDVIGFKDLGIKVNFFEAGGDSLKAVKLISAINREFSKKLTLDTLFDEGSIESLAIKLGLDNESTKSTSLIPFVSRTDTVKSPLFLVHPLSGSAMCYSHLAHRLDYPLYGIQQYGNEEMKSFSFKSIQDIASYYIKSILSVQLEGPYLIGGWSLGGIIAYEMVQQLENMGHSINKIIMFDSISPGKMQKDLDMFAILKLCLEEAAKQFGVKADINLDGADIEDSTGIYELVLKQLKLTGAFTPDTEIEALQELVNVCTNNIRLANNYQGGKINSDILLLRPNDNSHVVNMLSNPQDLADKCLGWQAFTNGNVTALDVKGAHMSMLFEPNVQFVAKLIKEYLKNNE